MNYIYDLILNFQKEDCDFYDWNSDDKFIHIRKSPLFRVDSDVLYTMVNFDFTVDDVFLKKIINRTEVFSKKNIKIIKNMCVVSDGKEAIAIKFTNSGKKEKMSRMLLEDKEDILDIANSIEVTNINTNVEKRNLNNLFRTREEQKIYNYIQKELNIENYDKLKYTYFECFNRVEDKYETILSELNKLLNNNWNTCYKRIYNILKLSSTNKSKNQ